MNKLVFLLKETVFIVVHTVNRQVVFKKEIVCRFFYIYIEEAAIVAK